MSVDQIADKCGFYNISNFYRQFKKVIGVTPLTYKREYLMVENFNESLSVFE
jgi:AraC-like DNA-binding protein